MIEFDLKPLNKIVKDMSKNIQRIDKGKKTYLDLLINRLRLQQTLESHIDSMVYSNTAESVYSGNTSTNQQNNTWYQRTGDLKRSVDLTRDSNSIFLFTNKEFLENRPQATEYGDNLQYGTGTLAHSILSNYAWNVELGHTYQNEYGSDQKISPRPFMRNTFRDIKSKMSGSNHPGEILNEFIKGWRN